MYKYYFKLKNSPYLSKKVLSMIMGQEKKNNNFRRAGSKEKKIKTPQKYSGNESEGGYLPEIIGFQVNEKPEAL